MTKEFTVLKTMQALIQSMVLITIRRCDFVQPVEHKIQADKPKVRTIGLKCVVFEVVHKCV